MHFKFIQSFRAPSKEEVAEQDLVLAALSETMNTLHETTFSERFWSEVLGSYVRICFRQKKPLSRGVVNERRPLQDLNSPRIPGRLAVLKFDLLVVARSLRRLLTGSFVPTIDPRHSNVLVGERMSLSGVHDATVWRPRSPLPIFGNRKKRDKLEALAAQHSDAFLANVCRQLPRIYVEYFDVILNKLGKLQNASKLTFHSEHADVSSRIVLAYCREQGARIIFYQLGGFFGEVEGYPPVWFHRRADIVRTYGWRIDEKDEPYYAIRLEEFAQLYAESDAEKKDIDLLVVYNGSINNPHLRDHYIEVTERLGTQLDSARFPSITLRPRGKTRMLSNRSQLAVLRNRISADIDAGMIHMSALCARSSIVLHLEHPTTNFLECVFVDQPVVALLTNDHPTDLVVPYYEFFLARGVMHTDIASLVEHLNSVDVETWWAEIVQSDEYRRFKSLFARSRKDYEKARH